MAPCLHNSGDVLIVEPQNIFITVVPVMVIVCELDSMTLLELHLSSATLNQTREREPVHYQGEHHSKKPLSVQIIKEGLIEDLATWLTHALDKSSPDFWSLGVQSDGHRSVVYGSSAEALSCLTDIPDGLSVILDDVGR